MHTEGLGFELRLTTVCMISSLELAFSYQHVCKRYTFIYDTPIQLWWLWYFELRVHKIFHSLHGIIIMFRPAYLSYLCLNFCTTQRFTSEEQGFPLCYSPTHSGPDGCQHVDMMEIVLYPMLLYIVWQLLYIGVVRLYSSSGTMTGSSIPSLITRPGPQLLLPAVHVFLLLSCCEGFVH